MSVRVSGRFSRQRTRRLALVLVWRISSAFLGFAATLAVSRRLGADSAGTFFLSVAIVSIAATLSRLGLDIPVMRLVATAGDAQNGSQQTSVVRAAAGLSGVTGLLLTAAILLGAGRLGVVFNDPSLGSMLRVVSIGLVPLALGPLYARGLMSVGHPALAEFGQRAGQQLVFVLLVVTIGAAFGGLGAGIAFGASFVAVLILLVRGWISSTAGSANGADSSFLVSDLLRSGLPLLFVSSTNLVMSWSDTLMIGYFLNPADVGIYSAAIRIAGTVSFTLVALGAVFGPEFARKLDVSDQIGFARDFQRAGTVAGGAALAIAVPIVLLAPQILAVFGAGFVAGSSALRILVMGQVFNSAAGLVGLALAMGKRETRVLHSSGIAGVVNVGLNLLLIPIWGISGAATATMSSMIVFNILVAFWAKRDLRVSVFGRQSAAQT